MTTTDKKLPGLPLVHLNGSGAKLLIELRCNAYVAINSAIDVLRQAAPHGRDYYPIGPDAYEEARQVHMSRLKRLADVQDELAAEANALQRD